MNLLWLVLGAGIATGIILGVEHNKNSSDNTCPSSDNTPTYNPAEYDLLDKLYNITEPVPFNQTANVRTNRIGVALPNPVYTRLIAYTRTQYHLPSTNQSTTTLWISILSEQIHSNNLTANAFRLTKPQWGISDSSPQWSKDGRHLLFLSNRNNNGTQLYQLPIPSDLYHNFNPLSDVITDMYQLTNFPISIDNFLLSPTNDVAAVSVQVYPGMNMYETVAYQQQQKESGVEGELYDKLYVRHWDEWFQCRPEVGCLRNHPHLITFTQTDNNKFQLVDVYDVLYGIDSDSPTKPFGGTEQWSFNSRGRIFAFTRQQTGAGENTSVAWGTDLNIHTLSYQLTNISHITTFNSTRCLTCSGPAANPGEDTNPLFSPAWNQPNTLAYLSMIRPQYESDRLRLRLMSDISTGLVTELTTNWDLSVSSHVWAAPSPQNVSSEFFVQVEEAARDVLYRIDIYGTIQPLRIFLPSGSITAHAVSADGNYIVHSWSSMVSPSSLYVFSLQSLLPKPITFDNTNWLKNVHRTPNDQIEAFDFGCSNNDTCHGWLMKPLYFAENVSYPMAFLIHGGPQGAWTDSWSYRWNPQVYAAAGFVVVMINPHGSTGYGQNFTDAIVGRYGSWPFEDLTKYGMDYVLKEYKFINESRVVALGASYGGYMINWIAGQPDASKRFTALVSHDGMFDIRAFYYQTEEVYFPEHDNGGVTPFADPAAYEEWSPIRYVGNWTQPMFVIHGGHDYRIPESNGISVFTATQRRNIKGCKFLFFPKENHWVLKTANSIFWHTEVLAFIKEHTRL